MFPGKHDNYGIFVKKTYDFFERSSDLTIEKISAIRGKSQNKYLNIIRYIFLLLNILIHIIFCNKKFDIVYIQYVWKHAFFTNRFSNILLKKNKKIVINFHGEDLTEYDKYSGSEKKNFINLCKVASAIVVPSQYYKELVNDTVCDNYTSKIIVTPSGGVDSKFFFKENKKLKEHRIVYCSRFDKNKGWDDFINAAKLLNDSHVKVSFLMIGYGKDTDKVKELIGNCNLSDKIEVMINPRQNEISEKYTESDLFIFPTRRLAESLGLVALEAMSCGLPVIASNIGAISEYVENAVNGYLYTPGNVQELVDKIILYLNQDEKRKELMSEASLKTAEKYKDVEVEIEFINAIKNYCFEDI